MKTLIIKFNIVALAMLFIICGSVFVSANYTNKVDISNVFLDVQKDSWYYSGVQTVYENGIMNGTSPGMFTPDGTVTWAQAIKIASEIRCLYKKDIIEESGDLWYEKYVNYMRENSILPANYPTDNPDMVICRSDIAELFYSAVPKEELIQINSYTLNDIKEDRNKNAIQGLCNAGILTGKGENKFDPDGELTRAEISIIIDRILLPVNRVVVDVKHNENMKNQMSLFDNGGLAVETADNVFYIYCDRTPAGNVYEIISYGNEHDIKTIYTTEDKIRKMSIGIDGRIYFVSNGDIKSITQEGKDVKTVYTGATNVSNPISYYAFYDDVLYVTECYETGTKIEDFRWRIGYIINKKMHTIQTNITNENLGSENFYLFNGDLYKVFSKNQEYGLCKIDINTGKQTTVIEKIYKADVAFIDHNVWYTNKVGNSLEFVRSPLYMPEFKHVVGTYEGLDSNYSTLTARDEKVYFQVSSLMKIWEINKYGDLKEIANTNNSNIEKFTITRHGIIFNARENITQLLHDSMMVSVDENTRITYGELLNKLSCSKGTYTVQQGDKVKNMEIMESEEGKINVFIQRDVKKENGDVVLEFLVNNLTDREAIINSFDICLDGEKVDIEKRFMINLTIGNGKTEIFSIFIPKEEISKLDGRFKIKWKFNAKLK